MPATNDNDYDPIQTRERKGTKSSQRMRQKSVLGFEIWQLCRVRTPRCSRKSNVICAMQCANFYLTFQVSVGLGIAAKMPLTECTDGKRVICLVIENFNRPNFHAPIVTCSNNPCALSFQVCSTPRYGAPYSVSLRGSTFIVPNPSPKWSAWKRPSKPRKLRNT